MNNANGGSNLTRARPRSIPGVQIPPNNSPPSQSRPPLHQSPRPPNQQLHFQPNFLPLHVAPVLPPHSREASLFSPRPNDVYTPLAKLDGTPKDSGGPSGGAMGYAAALQQVNQYYADSGLASPTPLYSGSSTTQHRRPRDAHEFQQPQQQWQQVEPSQLYLPHSSSPPAVNARSSPPSQSAPPLNGSPLLGSRANRSPPKGTRGLAGDAFSLDGRHNAFEDDSTGKSGAHGVTGGFSFAGFDSSMQAGTFNLTNVILGSGIVALPAAIAQSGVVVGLFLILLQALVTNYSLRLLVRCALSLKVGDYEELLRACFGRRGWLTGLAAIFALDFGVMVAFLIIITDTFVPVLGFYFGTNAGAVTGAASDEGSSIFQNRTFTLVLLSFLTILPLSCARSLKQLGWVSMASVGSVIGIVALLGWKIGTGGGGLEDASIAASTAAASASSLVSHFPLSTRAFFSAFGSISFVFVCHDASFAVFQSLAQPTQRNWTRVVHAAVSTALLPMTILALCGYYAFVDAPGGVQGNVLNNFPPGDHLVNVARVALGSSMILTYPLNLFMCRHAVIKWLGIPSVHHLTPAGHLGVTLALFLASLILACMFRNLGAVQSLVGGVAGSMLAFILPALAGLQTAKMAEGRTWVSVRNAKELALLTLGVLVLVVTLWQSLVTE